MVVRRESVALQVKVEVNRQIIDIVSSFKYPSNCSEAVIPRDDVKLRLKLFPHSCSRCSLAVC